VQRMIGIRLQKEIQARKARRTEVSVPLALSKTCPKLQSADKTWRGSAKR
jgi:hypothetical protein